MMKAVRKQHRLTTNTLFIAITGFVALLISSFTAIKLSHTESAYSRMHSPWIVVYIFPFLFGIALIIYAILLAKRKKIALSSLAFISQYKTWLTIAFLGITILVIHIMSIYVDLTNEFINLGMHGIGLLIYSLALILLIYTLFFHNKNKKHNKNRFLALSFLVIGSTWLTVSISKFGLEPDIAFWNVAGVPVMWISLATILFAFILLAQLINWLKGNKTYQLSNKAKSALEILLIVVIWLSATLIWINTPYSNSYFLTEALPPDKHHWPSSDAELMDLGGQYLIIGEKLETPYFTEKPFYALFLGLLHFIFGQSYEIVTNVQIAFLAFIPVFLYLIGKKLYGRSLGLALAIFAIIKEANAIFSTYKISVSHSRLMMTEMPSALLLVILTYLLIKWIDEGQTKLTPILLAGVISGIAIFIRTNNLFVFFILIGFLLLIGFKKIRKQLLQVSLFVIGALIIILPWTIYCQVNYGKDPLTHKIQAALTTRFIDSDDQKETIDPTDGESYLSDIDQQSLAIDITADNTQKPSDTSLIENKTNDQTQRNLSTSIDKDTQFDPFYKNKISIFLAHFLNNQIKSLFILPFQFYPANLDVILSQEYWHEPVSWNGNMPLETIIAFMVNLIFIAMGLSYAWKKYSWPGLLPLIIQLSYHLSNALVRTSGSRYLVPVDWVIYFYFFIGIWTLLQDYNILLKMLPSKKTQRKKSNTQKGIWIAISIALIIGLSLPVLNLAFPKKYHNESKEQIYQHLPAERILFHSGYQREELQTFYERPNTVLLYGRSIYPAFLKSPSDLWPRAMRLTLLSPDLHDVILPQSVISDEKLPAGEDTYVIGCKNVETGNIMAFMVYFSESDKLFWSTATAPKNFCKGHE